MIAKSAKVGDVLALFAKRFGEGYLAERVTVVRAEAKYIWVRRESGADVKIRRLTGRWLHGYVAPWTAQYGLVKEGAQWRENGTSWALALVRYARQVPDVRARELAERIGALLSDFQDGAG